MFYSGCITIIIEVLHRKRSGCNFATVRFSIDKLYLMIKNYSNNKRFVMIKKVVVFFLVFLNSYSVFADNYKPDSAFISQLLKENQQTAERFNSWARELKSENPEIKVASGNREYGDIVYSPDSKYFLTSSGNNLLLVEIETGIVIKALKTGNPKKHIVFKWFSSDGRHAIFTETSGIDGMLNYHIIDLASGKTIKSLSLKGHSNGVTGADLSRDGRQLITSSKDKKLILWNLESGKKIREYPEPGLKDSSVFFCPDSDYALICNPDIKLINLATGKVEKQWKGKSPSINFPGGKYIAFTSIPDRKTVNIAEIKSGRIIRSFKHDSNVYWIDLALDSKYLYTYDKEKVYRWNIGAESLDWESDRIRGSMINISPDNSTLIISDYMNTGFVLLDPLTGDVKKRIKSSAVSMNSIRHSSKNVSYFCGGSDGSIRQFSVFNGRLINSLKSDRDTTKYKHSEKINDLCLSHDEQYILVGKKNGFLTMWSIKNEKILKTYKTKFTIRDVALSPDNKVILYTTFDPNIIAIDAESGKELFQISGFRHDAPRDFVFSSDGKYILSASDYGMKLFASKTGKEIRSFNDRVNVNYYNSVVFSPDGLYIAGGGLDNKIYLFNTQNGQLIRSFTGHDNIVKSVSFSPDGKFLLSSSDDRTLRLWNVDTGEIITTIRGFSSSINSTFITSDNNHALSCSDDGVLKYWNLTDGELIYTTIADSYGHSVTWTPEGYFAGDEEFARKTVYIVNGLTSYSIDQFFDTYFRPDIVQAKIAGKNISELAGDKKLVDDLALTPEVNIEVEQTDGSFHNITNSQKNYNITNGSIKLKISAIDQGGGAEEIRVFHNGVRISGKARGLSVTGYGKIKIQNITVKLADGENTIRALAFTTNRIESRPSVLTIRYRAPQKIEPTLWILAVGINKYKNGRYNLNYAVNDADSFIKAVKKSGKDLYKSIETILLTNKMATRQSIIDALRKITNSAKPEDVFMFFYAGHGIALESIETKKTEFFFIPTDVTQMTDFSKVMNSGLGGSEFEVLVSSIPARKQFLVLDACNSGAINTAFGLRGAAEEIALSRLGRATGSALIAASRDDQFAQEFASLGQGALTKALLDGLNGKAAQTNGQITVGGLKNYVESELPDLTEKYAGQAQYPTGFPIGIYP